MNPATTSASAASTQAAAVQVAHLRIVRGHQARALVQLSLTNLIKTAAAQPPTGETVRNINSIRHRLELREQRGSRFKQFDRVHDIGEATDALAQVAALLQSARLQNMYVEEWPGQQVQTDAKLAGLPSHLARLMAERLTPAAQCVLSHLPAPTRAAHAAELAQSFSLLAHRLDFLRRSLENIATERVLWRVQCGVLDCAFLEVVAGATLITNLASGMEAPAGTVLRARCESAGAQLAAVFNSHTEKMRECVMHWLLVPGNRDVAKLDELMLQGFDVLRDEKLAEMGARKDDPPCPK